MEYKDFNILICLIQIWDMENPQDPMGEPKQPLLITEVENIEIDESYRKLIGTASVKFPRGTILHRTITKKTPDTDLGVTTSLDDAGAVIVTRTHSKKAETSDFKIGCRIKIRLGMTPDYKVADLAKPDKDGKSIHNDPNKLAEYEKHLVTMFDGYIVKCSIDYPIEIKCENLASKLKKISCPDKTFEDVTVNDLFSETGGPSYNCNFLKHTELKLHPQTKNCEINVGTIELNTHLTIADVLSTWQKSGIMSFVKEYDGQPCLAIGRAYFSNAGKDSVIKFQDESSVPKKILFDWHVAQNNLSLVGTELLFLAIEATALDEQGKFYHITIRLNPEWDGKSSDDKYQLLNEVTISKKAQQMGATVLSKSQGNKKVDLSTYTILPYMSAKMGASHEDLVKEAIKYFESCYKNGIEGTLTLFGDLSLKSGSVVELVDERYPHKNGYYFVEEVYTTFGVGGYRQRIKLPYRISSAHINETGGGKEMTAQNTGSQPKAEENHIDAIMIHCSASKEGQDVKMESIKNYHINSLKWDDIGYNYVIELDGTVKKGRSLDMDGAHCSLPGTSGKSYNKHSIGICYIGGLSKDNKAKDTRTDAQKAAMHKLVKELCQKYDIKEVLGHRDASKDKNNNGTIDSNEYVKSCPSFDVIPEFSQYISIV